MSVFEKMQSEKYAIKPGFKVPTKYAQPAGELMSKLERENNLTGQSVVDASRDSNAPLHDYFEWNDAIAAEKHRVEQARYMIRSICVVRKESKTEPFKKVKLFYNFEECNPEYKSIETIVQSEDMSLKLYQTAVRELKGFATRYAIIRDRLSSVIDAIDQLESV